MSTRSTVVGAVFAVIALAAAAGVAGTLTARHTFTVIARAPTSAKPLATGRSVLFGVSTPAGPRDLSELDAFEGDAGTPVDVVMYYQGWAVDEFDPGLARSVAGRGALPEITWEPWDFRAGLHQPDYALARIVDGTHDGYITRWAEGAKAYAGPLLLRFGHEMNGRHYPWSEQVNGNGPGQYVEAWRHVVDIFRGVGATNVAWIWSPVVSSAGTTPLEQLYPGDGYVDWVGVDGYNGGSALPWGGWQSFSRIFDATLTELAAITTAKPVMVAETASVERGGSKAAWITDFFAQLARHPEIKGFVWFNHDKEADWRIQSSEAAREAFAAGVATLRPDVPCTPREDCTGTVLDKTE